MRSRSFEEIITELFLHEAYDRDKTLSLKYRTFTDFLSAMDENRDIVERPNNVFDFKVVGLQKSFLIFRRTIFSERALEIFKWLSEEKIPFRKMKLIRYPVSKTFYIPLKLSDAGAVALKMRWIEELNRASNWNA